MKTQKIAKYLKLGLFLFGISILLWNCEKEEVFEKPLKKNTIETVSIKRAKELFANFNKKRSLLSKGGKESFEFEPLWETIHQEELSFTEAQLTNLEIKPRVKLPYKPRLFFIKINGYHIKAFETTIAEEVYTTGKIKKGVVYYHSIEGVFMTAYSIESGKTATRLKLRQQVHKAGVLSFLFPQDDWWCGIDDIDGGVLDNVDIPPSESMEEFMSGYNPSGNFYPTESGTTGSGEGGGGGVGDTIGDIDNDPTNCPGIKIKNPNTGICECPSDYKEELTTGNCVVAPCNVIKAQIDNAKFNEKKEELSKLTNKKQETGYAQNKVGSTFTKLNPINGGHSLDFGGISYNNINGFIHTHLDNFPTGEIDKISGLPKIYEIYRMFSPADVIAFLAIAKQSNNVSKVYATVITSSGNYTLKFTGNTSDITGLKTADAYKKDYIKYMDDKGKEKGFLHFLKDHIKVNGIQLYKLHKPLFSSTIKIQHKTLNNNGKVDKIECE